MTKLTNQIRTCGLGTAILLSTLTVQALEPLEALDQALNSNAQAEMQKLQSAMQSNPILNKRLSMLQLELKAIGELNKPAEIKQKLSEKELIKNQRDIDEVFVRAKVDSIAYFKKQEDLVNRFNQKSKRKMKLTKSGRLSYSLIESVDFSAPTEGAEIVLSAPFPLFERVENGPGRVSISVDNTEYRVVAVTGWHSSYTNKGGLGHFFEVPTGTHRLRVSAKLPEIASFVNGFAMLGSGMGSTTAEIVVEGEENILCRKNNTIQILRVYFLDSAQVNTISNLSVACEFEAPPAGQEIVVRFLGLAKVDSNFANVGAETRTSPENIRIRLNPVQ